ncbi:MAG TPA: DUF4390 domain-containing protein [Thermodesulfobacteriota bacterium]|nr:DUF4390 domain-containing protein [Thermodesulfobacteriota bacterium]
MINRIRNRWIFGGLVLFLILSFPPWVFSQKASIREVQIKGSNGNWRVSFSVENCFTEKIEEAIQTGIPTTLTFYLQLCQVRSWWRDRKVASLQFQHTVEYSPIQKEYQVTLGEKGISRVTQNFEEAKRWMAKVQEAEIKLSSEIKLDVLTYLRIKTELDPVKLPLHLEYLYFFASLWGFETDWHVEPLYP